MPRALARGICGDHAENRKDQNMASSIHKPDGGLQIILVGNPRDGYRALGPFRTRDAVEEYIAREPVDCDSMTVIPLEAQAEWKGF